MRPPGQPQGARHRPSRGGTAERAREGVGPNGMPSGTDRLTDGLGRLTGEPVDLHGRGVWDSSRARSLMLEEGETNVYQFFFFRCNTRPRQHGPSEDDICSQVEDGPCVGVLCPLLKAHEGLPFMCMNGDGGPQGSAPTAPFRPQRPANRFCSRQTSSPSRFSNHQ